MTKQYTLLKAALNLLELLQKDAQIDGRISLETSRAAVFLGLIMKDFADEMNRYRGEPKRKLEVVWNRDEEPTRTDSPP